jgi:hypothetical protein
MSFTIDNAPEWLCQVLGPLDERMIAAINEAVEAARSQGPNHGLSADEAGSMAARLMAMRASMLVVRQILLRPGADPLIDVELGLRELHESNKLTVVKVIEGLLKP